MINFKRNLRENSNANLKSRSKSIYRGDKSHTVSMNLRIDHELSPDSIRNAREPYLVSHKQSMKENQGQKFRDSLKITENSLSGKKSYRDDISGKSSKKIIQSKPLETDRYFKQVSNISSRKSILNKNDKSIYPLDRLDSKSEAVTVNQAELKDFFVFIKKLASENA